MNKQSCCQCGGQGKVTSVDVEEQVRGILDACYHCQTEGVCNCKPIECLECNDSGQVIDQQFEVEFIEFPGQARYWWTYKECVCVSMGAKDMKYREVRD